MYSSISLNDLKLLKSFTSNLIFLAGALLVPRERFRDPFPDISQTKQKNHVRLKLQYVRHNMLPLQTDAQMRKVESDRSRRLGRPPQINCRQL